jgi:DNA-directed RNA polymerase specialized sigma subunit
MKCREKEMLKLLKKGFTYKQIGEQYGVSRQRIHQFLKSKYGQELLTGINKRIRNKLK